MIGFELAERAPDRAKAIVDAAFERGLLLLSCGLYGNVIRLLPALTISDEELAEGLGLLEESVVAAAA
jgi:4-aminobutyrate aminotransferase-like enzyme